MIQIPASVMVAVDKITPSPRNTKKHPQSQINNVAKSIERFGFVQPLVLDENNEIIIGHCRLSASKKLGMKEVPCVYVENLTEEDVRALRIIDNKLNESEWDLDILSEELQDIDLGDFEDLDFGIEEETESKEIVEDEAPEVDEENEPIVKLGDIWQLGRHRLMCGDSTDKATVEMLMDGKKADMVMTDPPYGINAEKMTMGKGKRDFYRGKDWDCERPEISIVFDIAPLVCIWGGNYFTDKLPITNDWLIWHKKNDGLSFSECEMAWTNFGVNCRHISHHWGNEKKQHVTMKPLSVIAWAIERAKEKATLIVDLFGGSGTTLIACEQLNRTCYMMELDPKYCDVILKRWENLTGQKAEKIN